MNRITVLIFAITASVSASLLSSSADARIGTAGWTKTRTANVDYWMYRPGSLKDAPDSSLMLNLHGCKQTADLLKDLANWEAAAEKFKMTVVIPFVPNGGVVLGCWDYYGRDQTEDNKFNRPLIELTEELLRTKELAISPDRVFVSGLSSGATQAMILGCLRPDLFRGVGTAAGPIIGSELSEVYRPKITSHQAALFCESLAGSRRDAFARQRFSIIFDAHDPTVNAAHSVASLEAVTELYGGGLTETKLDLNKCQGANKQGYGSIYHDASGARILYLQNTKLGHAWPSGAGTPLPSWPQSTFLSSLPKLPGQRTFINPDSLNYPMILGRFFHR